MHKVTSGLWILAVCVLPVQAVVAQSCPIAIRGGWEAVVPIKALFKITIELEMDAEGKYAGRLVSSGSDEKLAVRNDTRSLRMHSERFALTFEGRPSPDRETIDGFVNFSSNIYRVTLQADGRNRWTTNWSPVPLVAESVVLDLYIDDDGAGGTGGYFFFRDGRLPSLYGLGATCSGNEIVVREKNLGLRFSSVFDDAFSNLSMTVSGPGGNSSIVFVPMSAERRAMSPGASDIFARQPGAAEFSGSAPENVGDGWRTAPLSDSTLNMKPFVEVVDAVSRDEFPNTHSILVAKSGRLVFEEYFYGFDRDVLHDMRSASKSLASTLIGLAIDRNLIDGSEATVLPFFPEYRSYEEWDSRKAKITLRNLMTMSSGLDANDSDRNSVAAEGTYQSQSAQPDWTKLALDAPMIAEPGKRLIYGGANPLILGSILDNVIGDRVEWFAEEALFRPLGIVKYRIYLDPLGVPYLGGGMYLRPRDMLKIGQMYLDDGKWQGRQVLSDSWVAESFGRYGRLEPLESNGNEYGYLWWHENYEVNGQRIESIEARGYGGQYIFVVPELEMVAVITSGNYRGGLAMTRQPQTIFQRYLLPAFVD